MQYMADETSLQHSGRRSFVSASNLQKTHSSYIWQTEPYTYLFAKEPKLLARKVPFTLNMIMREPSVDTSRYRLQGDTAKWVAENET